MLLIIDVQTGFLRERHSVQFGSTYVKQVSKIVRHFKSNQHDIVSLTYIDNGNLPYTIYRIIREYRQYRQIVKNQNNGANEIHDYLTEHKIPTDEIIYVMGCYMDA